MSAQEPIRVCLIDDQTRVHQGIKSLLDLVSDISVVVEAAAGQAGLACIQQSQPDVVLLDLRMPVLNGIGL